MNARQWLAAQHETSPAGLVNNNTQGKQSDLLSPLDIYSLTSVTSWPWQYCISNKHCRFIQHKE